MWDLLAEAVSRCLHWLKRLFKIFWGIIKGWWSKLKGYVKDALSEGYREVVVIDQRQDGGYELMQLIEEKCPNVVSVDAIDGLVSVKVNQDGSVAKVEDLEADAQSEDQFDSISEDKDGVIRIK